MKKRRSPRNRLTQDDLSPEYRFDYTLSRWGEEAERRDREWDAKSDVAKPAREVLRKARAKLK